MLLVSDPKSVTKYDPISPKNGCKPGYDNAWKTNQLFSLMKSLLIHFTDNMDFDSLSLLRYKEIHQTYLCLSNQHFYGNGSFITRQPCCLSRGRVGGGGGG